MKAAKGVSVKRGERMKPTRMSGSMSGGSGGAAKGDDSVFIASCPSKRAYAS